MSFATFHDEQSAFFNAKFHPYVLSEYSNWVFSSFSFFANTLILRFLLTGVSVTESLLKSPELSSVFWPILIRDGLYSSSDFLGFLVPWSILWELVHVYQLQLISPSHFMFHRFCFFLSFFLSFFFSFFALMQIQDIYLSFCFLLILLSYLLGR